MHEVTANKFRPQNFEELVGQDFVTQTIKNSIANKKIPNAYLLSGPKGCGKTSTARIISKALNCVNGPTATPCNECVNCISITNGNNTDVIEIDGASNTRIDDVRTIQEEIQYPPTNCNYKVYIIDEVHMLSKNAFNALLKTIEEPPARVIFIFATTEINKVPATIRSRCQQFNLKLIPHNLICDSLEKVLKTLNVKFEPLALKWIANEGKGSMRDSYTLLDQVVSFCDRDITLKKIQEKLGITTDEKILNLVSSIIKKDRAKMMSLYFDILENGISPEQIIIDLIKFFRNLLIKKLDINSNRFIDFNKELLSNEFLNNFTFNDIENILELLFKTYEKIRYSTMSELDIEITLFRLLKYKDIIHPKEILKEIDKLKYTLVTGKVDPVFKDDILEKIIFEKEKLSDSNTNNSEYSNKFNNKFNNGELSHNENIDHDQNMDYNENNENNESVNNKNIEEIKNKDDNLLYLKELFYKIADRLEKSDFNFSKAIRNIINYRKNGDDLILFVNEAFIKDTLDKDIAVLKKELMNFIQKDINISVELVDKLDDSNFKTNVLKFKKIFNGRVL